MQLEIPHFLPQFAFKFGAGGEEGDGFLACDLVSIQHCPCLLSWKRRSAI